MKFRFSSLMLKISVKIIQFNMYFHNVYSCRWRSKQKIYESWSFLVNCPWDWDHIGIKKGTLCVIYRWKASLLGNQNIYVNKILSVSIKD